jgi:uncharacterized membrane protein YcaP (DUF421 family)
MDVILRAAIIFVVIWLVMRIAGRRELSNLEPFDLIILVTIGDLVQQGINQQDLSVTGIVLVIGTLALMTLLFSWLSYRFRRLRPLLEGRPIVLLEDGKPIERNLRRERITLEELAAQARLEQIESFDKIRWAVLETGGRISFIPKAVT